MRILTMIAALFMAALPAQAETGLNTKQKQEVEKLIADYFIANPEALGGALENMQAHYQKLEEERKIAAIRNNARDLYNADGDFSMGPKDAPITIVEFFDYNCGYCKRAFEPLMQVMKENDDVRLVFKELPILSDNSKRAAQAALAIEDQLKFLTFHTKLMTHRGNINDAVVDRALEEVKLSPSKIRKAGSGAAVQKVLNRNQRVAGQLGISGTPAFVINDQIFPGALDKDRLDQAIADARTRLAN